MVVIPRYEPVFVEPNLKQYETQVTVMIIVYVGGIDDDEKGDDMFVLMMMELRRW